jgi:hypothetical protein
MAPVPAGAAELNLGGINRYVADEQVTSLSQFSDVKPTDWAYQALGNLIERYGCVGGYPNGTYKGGQAMTRFEAAALLNACLDRVSEVTDALKKLMAEFEKELAILKGRVHGLEAKVGVLEAQQFSTTTKLKGMATMVLGGVTYSSNNFNGENTIVLDAPLPEGLSFNYDVRLIFDTSFTGKDLLRTTLRAGNAANSAFGFNNGVATSTALEVFFQDPILAGGGNANNIVGISRLYYQFPIGSHFTATVGARVRQDDMLAMWPSVYPADSILELFTHAGSPVAYALNLGGGAGLWWRDGGFSISANYVSANAGNGIPGAAAVIDANGNATNGGGIGNNLSASSSTVQVGYAGSNWGLAGVYAYNQNLNYNATVFYTLDLFNSLSWGLLSSVNALALSGYWQPTRSGWLPSISAGWGLADYQLLSRTGGSRGGGGAVLNSWTVGLQWADAFIKGNALGMGFGQNTMVSKYRAGGGTPDDGNWAWEWWYKIQATDNISVTPGFFYLSRPLGGYTSFNATASNPYFSSFGYLIKTTFKF